VQPLPGAEAFFNCVNRPTDPALAAALSTVATTIEGPFLGTYRFNKAGPEKTDPVTREKRIKRSCPASSARSSTRASISGNR